MGAIITVPATVILTILSMKPSDFVFWFKWIVSYIYIEVTRRLKKKRFDLYDRYADNEPEKLNFITPRKEFVLESPYPESHLSDGADEVFFYGISSKSECLVTRIARGCNDEAEAWIYLKMKNGKIFQLKETSSYQQSCSDNKTFTCGGLQMHYLNPMRSWRIFFNGLLRETSDGDKPDSSHLVHVKFAVLWIASSDVFDFTSDVSSTELASGLAGAKWNKLTPPLDRLYKALDFYAQTGVITGSVSIDGNDEENMYLFGERIRFLGNTSLINGTEFFQVLGQIKKNGAFVHIAEASIPNVVEKLKYGFIVQPDSDMKSIKEVHLYGHFSEEANEDICIKSKFLAGGNSYYLEGEVTGMQLQVQSEKGWDGQLAFDCLDIQLNSYKGSGILMKGKVIKQSKRSALKSSQYETPADIPLCVHFSEKVCQDAEVSGGKGSSLGKLTHLSRVFQEFVVPNGIVVTTSAYKEFLNDATLKEIQHLEGVVYGNTSGDVKKACQSVMDEIVRCDIPQSVQQSIVKNLHKTFGDKMNSNKFAVRSSSTGEDTEQLSAAGQMETFLGVTGLNEIFLAVKKCWASQFGYVAVQYKRQNGQIINSPMAVVIQEMVPCDVAGVLFTCDPLTGNPTLMTITANYGLGESVVSGSEEPDTIELRRDAEDKLSINHKIIGAKSHRIVMGDEGTNVEDVSENDRSTCCLTDKMALRLGNLAVKLEKSYRSHRDIEWGFCNNNLYIFQSRPVTSGTGETDFEIDHEFDAPMRAEVDYFTVSNVGEVMPGAMSPLGLQVTLRYFRICFERQVITGWRNICSPKYFTKGMLSMYKHVMICAIDIFKNVEERKAFIDSMMVGIFGRVVDDEEIIETAIEKYKYSEKKSESFLKYYRLLKMFFPGSGHLKLIQKKFGNYRIPIEIFKTSQELYDYLLRSCSDIVEALQFHMIYTHSSSMWNMAIMSLLQKARGEMNSDVYSDLSQLLSTIGEVESADVPSALQSLAYHISNAISPENFKEMKTEEAIQWLETTTSFAGIKYKEFLEKHGHRCLQEFDVRSKTWGSNPQSLVKMLQNLVGSVPKELEKKKNDFNKVMQNLKIPIGFRDRCLLKIILPQCRQAVQYREASKSALIKAMNAWRKGYYQLARLMVSEGRIPDEDLLFFITLEEIRDLLSSRSPKIIAKANHRRRRHPVLGSYIFPQIMKGFPKPVNMDSSSIVSNEDNFMMKGIPVSQGVAKGYLRVALTLEEASHLKPGEILLTYSTDIGWSPYFPTLAGVVTELGGLISHGAVVSREYGLPCIAGLHDATRNFQTGDYVLLDGNKGILQKLPTPERS